MRINDGSICHDCDHFEHDCGNGSGCGEVCMAPDKPLEYDDVFYDQEDPIKECLIFKPWKGTQVR